MVRFRSRPDLPKKTEGEQHLIVTKQCRLVAPIVLTFVLYQSGSPLSAVADAEPATGAGLQQQLQRLLAKKGERSSDPGFLVRLADLYLSLGDDASFETSKRKASYEEGARVAHQAIELQEQNANAHYLYAANLGSAAQLNGMMASALNVQTLKHHVNRALELNPDHAPALHMMGMMLEKLPWFLGGDADGALTYLRRAVVVDPGYAHARLDLARAYVKRKDPDAARRELEIILQQPLSFDASVSTRRRRKEALQLRDSLRTP